MKASSPSRVIWFFGVRRWYDPFNAGQLVVFQVQGCRAVRFGGNRDDRGTRPRRYGEAGALGAGGVEIVQLHERARTTAGEKLKVPRGERGDKGEIVNVLTVAGKLVNQIGVVYSTIRLK
jgi:hypothetical protein